MKNALFRFIISLSVLFMFFNFGCGQKTENAKIEKETESELGLDKIPNLVMNALIAKFPQAEIHKWTEEEEDSVVIYDFEFKQGDQKFEADIKADGSIHNWEKEIGIEDVPLVVKKSVNEKYPNFISKEIMMITAIIDGRDVLEGYEIVLETADRTEVEVTVAPDGKILEDSGDEK